MTRTPPTAALPRDLDRGSPAIPANALQASPVRDLLALTERPGVISFAGGLPAPELLDAEAMAAAAERVLRGPSAARALQYSATEGLPNLREALAGLLAGDGVEASADQVLVTSGSQQAIALVAQVLLRPGDRVLVETPTYLAALQAFAAAGAVPVAVPTDEHGPLPDALATLAADPSARLLYLAPTFQNPTGRTISAERRRELARVIERQQLWTIEDEAYRALAYDGPPPPTLASALEATSCVISVRTLSKVAAPGLRIGWLQAPAELHRALAIAKQATDLHTATLTQQLASEWLTAGALAPQLVRLRGAYRARRDAMLQQLALTLPPGSAWTQPAGGMFVWARLPPGLDAAALLPRAIEHGTAFVPGRAFYAAEPDPHTLRLSFASHSPAQITEGLRRLAAALRA